MAVRCPHLPHRPDRCWRSWSGQPSLGLVATAGPRFFGFVIGGSLPAPAAADMLAVGWDQVTFNAVLSPAASVAEEFAGGWLKDLLHLPAVFCAHTAAHVAAADSDQSR